MQRRSAPAADSGRSLSSQSLVAGGQGPPPAADAPLGERLAWTLRVQADACEAMGSSLYAHLLRRAADDALAGGAVAEVLADHLAPGRADALALRLMAAAHRRVLAGQAPALAAHYPSAGGDGDAAAAWPAFRELLTDDTDRVNELVALPIQTNEVGRCAALVWGMLEVAATTGTPLRLLEVGSSAGLLLRLDQYRYGGAGAAWGPADSPVDLTGAWEQVPPAGTGIEVAVTERRGCDPAPVDVSGEEGRLALRAAVWADQTQRLARLETAITVARRVPVELTRASVETWLPAVLAEPAPGVTTVVFHSVVEEYLDADQRAVLHDTMRDAGARATVDAPVAWLRLEPISRLRHHGVTLTLWPDSGRERIVAVCGAHGAGVRRPPAR